jgi:16S rRNA (guanine1207-N2)-methyltransferase
MVVPAGPPGALRSGSSPGGGLQPGLARQPRSIAEHYFSPEPAVASEPALVELRLPDVELTLLADRGVFSSRRVDPGTLALLKESPAPPPEGHLLDLGCGYGPIACALAARSPAATVWAIEVNSRALQLTAANAKRLGLANVRPAAPEEVPEAVQFAAIWSNPPVRVGKSALHSLLATWLERLAGGASAWLVVNRHLGGDSLAQWLASEGWAVRRAASKSGYRVLEVSYGVPR